MKKKITFMSIFFLFSSFWVTIAFAVPVTFTFTADNEVAPYYYIKKDGGTYQTETISGSNLSEWRQSDTMTTDLAAGNSWEIIWQVVNTDLDAGYRSPESGNPGGFLAQFDITSLGTYDPLSNKTWDVAILNIDLSGYGTFDDKIAALLAPVSEATLNGLIWQKATEWAYNQGDYISGNPIGLNGTGIWTQNGYVQGISHDAIWIWASNNFDMSLAPGLHYDGGDNLISGDLVFVRVQVAPVPEPATMILVGSGLLGLAGLRRRFKK